MGMIRTAIDLWLDRATKVIGVIGFLGFAFVAANGLLLLPKKVEAQELEGKGREARIVATEMRVIALEKDVSYIREMTQLIYNEIKNAGGEHVRKTERS